MTFYLRIYRNKWLYLQTADVFSDWNVFTESKETAHRFDTKEAARSMQTYLQKECVMEVIEIENG